MGSGKSLTGKDWGSLLAGPLTGGIANPMLTERFVNRNGEDDELDPNKKPKGAATKYASIPLQGKSSANNIKSKGGV